MFIENGMLALNGLSAAIIFVKLPFAIVKIYPEEPDLSWLEIIQQLIYRVEKYDKGSTEGVSKYLPSELPVGEVIYSYYPWGMIKSDKNSNKQVFYESDGFAVLPLLVRDVISQIKSSTEAKSTEGWEDVVQRSFKKAQRRVKNGLYFDTDGRDESEAEQKNALRFSKIYYGSFQEAATHKRYLYIQSIISVVAFTWLSVAQYELGLAWTLLWVVLNVGSTATFFTMISDTENFSLDNSFLKNNDFAYKFGSFFWIHLVVMALGWVGMYASLVIQVGDF